MFQFEEMSKGETMDDILDVIDQELIKEPWKSKHQHERACANHAHDDFAVMPSALG